MATVPRACGHRVRHARGACAVTVGALNLIYNRVPDELDRTRTTRRSKRRTASRGARWARAPRPRGGRARGPRAPRRGAARAAAPVHDATGPLPLRAAEAQAEYVAEYVVHWYTKTPLDSLTTGKAVAPRALETEPMAQCPNADRRRLTPPRATPDGYGEPDVTLEQACRRVRRRCDS